MAKSKRVPAAKKVPKPKTARKSTVKNAPKNQAAAEQTQDTASQSPPPWASK